MEIRYPFGAGKEQIPPPDAHGCKKAGAQVTPHLHPMVHLIQSVLRVVSLLSPREERVGRELERGALESIACSLLSCQEPRKCAHPRAEQCPKTNRRSTSRSCLQV